MVDIRKGYVDTSIGQIHYRHAGKGDPLLLIHQTATCSSVFDNIIEHLSPSYSMVAMDTPGFGMSPYPPGKFTVPQYAAIVMEFLDALNISNASLFGHHTGASIACEVAASAPARVGKLILSGPACIDAAEGRQRLEKIPPIVLSEDSSYVLTLWNYILNLTPPGKRLSMDDMHHELVWRLKAGPRYIETYSAVFTYDMASRLPLIQAPTLVMAGEGDLLVRYVERAASLLKRSRRLIVPDAANFMMLQEPEELVRIIRDFLTDPRI